MIASVSIAARESFLVSTVSLLNSQARSFAVRNVHLPPTRTRLTPRGAYSSCRHASAARRSTPAGNREAKVTSSSGSAEANSIASNRRSSSGRAATAGCSGSSSGMIIFRSANPMTLRPPLALALGRVGGRRAAGIAGRVAGGRTLAQIDRRERRMLVHFDEPLAHHLERGGKARREHAGRHLRLDHIGDQELIDAAPVLRYADQTFERLARFGQ